MLFIFMKMVDISGLKSGLLTVLFFSHIDNGHYYWQCICECGRQRAMESHNLKTGRAKSCGCLGAEAIRKRATTHGHHAGRHDSPEITAYWNMMDRCYNPKNISTGHYRGRGIEVYKEWKENPSSFLEYIGKRPSPDYSIDRFPDMNGNYEPGNIRWATRSQQARNKTNTVFITYQGETKCLSDWSEILNIKKNSIVNHMNWGKSFEEAVGFLQFAKQFPKGKRITFKAYLHHLSLCA